MNKPKDIALADFNYPLPDYKIAKYPVQKRDNSKLLVYKDQTIRSDKFINLPEFLYKRTQLVFNISKVIHARLIFRKAGGARIEVFCLEPVYPFNYEQNLASEGVVTWKCLVGNSKKWKNEILSIEDKISKNVLSARRVKKEKNYELIRFHWDPYSKPFSEILSLFGKTPIPPYLGRESEETDSLKYQTVYSMDEGSVAAPTAGLHFTDSLLSRLRKDDFLLNRLTLHVGAGTFTPVKEQNGIHHKMHVERFHMELNSLKSLLSRCDHITAVGTTSCRTLESLYWMGVKILEGYGEDDITHLKQFEAYTLPETHSRKESLQAVIHYLQENRRRVFFGSTGIMISPGYTFRMTDCLITNFHQPSSTLLMLISAFIGDTWKEIYDFALKNNFRFLSYGDSSILYRQNHL